MSYLYNGSQINIAQPVQFISINKHHVVFTDKQGAKQARFAKLSDARHFVNWLKKAR